MGDPGLDRAKETKIWQEAQDLFRAVRQAVEKAGPDTPAGRAVAGEAVLRSLRIVEQVAASLATGDAARAREGLTEALADCRRLLAVVDPALEPWIDDEKRARLRGMTEGLGEALKGHIRFLINREIRRRYEEMDEL